VDLAVTLTSMLGGERVVCRTRDISNNGLSLDTAAWFPLGTRLEVTLMDPASGTALELTADVVREASKRWALGLVLVEPPVEWDAVVAAAARGAGAHDKPPKRMRVLVVGDDRRQRSAMAIYVTSGWDVLFASDEDSVAEALGNVQLDAVIAELDSKDPKLPEIMRTAKRIQPNARRIVRGPGSSEGDLVHRFVDRDGGLEPLLDAVTATIR
jgi:hypothetical protein